MIEVAVLGVVLIYNKLTESAVPLDSTSFNRFDSLFSKYAGYYLDLGMYDGAKILKAICMNESSLGAAASVAEGLRNPSNIEGSKSSDGKSWGIMQMTLPTAKDFDSSATAEKLNNPEYSVKLAAQYLAWVSLRFKTSDPRYLEWVVKSYNQGVGNTMNEMSTGVGYANVYWSRFQTNFAKV